MHYFEGTYENFGVEVVIRDKGKRQFLYEIKFIEKEKSSQPSMTAQTPPPQLQNGVIENNPIVTQQNKKSNPSNEKTLKKVSTNSGERSALPDGIDLDNDGDEGYNNYDLYTSTDEFIAEVASVDRHAFARSLAYKTNGMKKGEKKTLVIYCAANIYLFEADKYMHGRMISSISSKGANNRIKERKEYKNANPSRKTTNLWSEPIPDIGGNSRGGISIYENRRSATFDDILFEDSSRSAGTGNTERNDTNYRYDKREIDEIVRKLQKNRITNN